MEKFLIGIGGLAFVLFCGLLAAITFAFPVKWLWNWVAVDCAQMSRIDVWHAWGIMMLCGLLFKSSNSNSTK